MSQDNAKSGKKSGFVQVSLPILFANELKGIAEKSGRSMSEQIQHFAKIGAAVELIAPSPAVTRIKESKNSSDVLQALGSVLNSDFALFKEKLNAAGLPYYGSHPTKQGVVIRYGAGGTKTEGVLDEFTGTFTSHENRGKFCKKPPAPKRKVNNGGSK